VRPPPLVTLLSLYAFSSTFSIGAFPALLPELGRVAGLADWQIGLVAGLLGFARMAADIPVGLVITPPSAAGADDRTPPPHSRRALSGGGGSFGLLAVGRGVMGVGHALAVVGGLTALLRCGPAATMGSALTAFEISAMIGVLGGTVLVGLLPSWLPWNGALLIACFLRRQNRDRADLFDARAVRDPAPRPPGVRARSPGDRSASDDCSGHRHRVPPAVRRTRRPLWRRPSARSRPDGPSG